MSKINISFQRTCKVMSSREMQISIKKKNITNSNKKLLISKGRTWFRILFSAFIFLLLFSDWLFHYISWIIKGLVPILFCSVSLFLLLFSVRKPKWREPFFFFCTWILGIATVLQWDLMAPFADLHRMINASGGLGSYYRAPWNVILHSFSAFLTTIVMIASMVILMKKLIVNVMANDKMEEPLMTTLDDFEAPSHI
ncbi:hypothetical protein ACJMK2_008680 [Sinanodonta woodiana]|uniref:Uncharacterized protein n=1 Tax=Sinanodonta woodiana TaxID=1069815 RepID=A0ABD3VMB3_SINWO